jgi:hypothetical protein
MFLFVKEMIILSNKESGLKGWTDPKGTAQGSRYRAQGKTIKENLFSPYALRLTPCALNLFCQQRH